jgi:hypothetical protein
MFILAPPPPFYILAGTHHPRSPANFSLSLAPALHVVRAEASTRFTYTLSLRFLLLVVLPHMVRFQNLESITSEHNPKRFLFVEQDE